MILNRLKASKNNKQAFSKTKNSYIQKHNLSTYYFRSKMLILRNSTPRRECLFEYYFNFISVANHNLLPCECILQNRSISIHSVLYIGTFYNII